MKIKQYDVCGKDIKILVDLIVLWYNVVML